MRCGFWKEKVCKGMKQHSSVGLANSARLALVLSLCVSGSALAAADMAKVAGPLPDGTPVAALASADFAQDAGSPQVVPPPPYVPSASTTAPPTPAQSGQTPLPVFNDPYAARPDGTLPPLPVEPQPVDPAAAVAAARASAEPPAGATESLRDAIVEALKANPEIQIALARQDDAKYGVDEARAGYMPRLDMTVAIGGELNRPQIGANTDLRRSEGVVTLNQNLWDWGTTINDIKRARASYRSAQWSTRERIEAIAYDMTLAYLSVLQQQKLVALSNEEIAANEKIVKIVGIQADLGLTTPADVSRATARLDNVRAILLDRTSALQQARESYRRLTNRLPGIAVDLPPTAPVLPMTADAAVGMIDTRSPRMAQAVEDRRSLDRQRASQTGTFFPRLALQAQGNWRDDVLGNTGTNKDARAMLTVTYNFFNGGADIAVRNRISARLRQADYELDRRRREVEQDIRIDFNALDAARGKIVTIESEIQSAEKVVSLYAQQFREGRRTVFDLLDSQNILFNARASQITNMTAKSAAEYRVLQKLGSLFDLVSGGEALPQLAMPAPVRGN